MILIMTAKRNIVSKRKEKPTTSASQPASRKTGGVDGRLVTFLFQSALSPPPLWGTWNAGSVAERPTTGGGEEFGPGDEDLLVLLAVDSVVQALPLSVEKLYIEVEEDSSPEVPTSGESKRV